MSLPLLRYVVDYESDERVPQPAPRVLPAQFKEKPHEFVKLLNKGQMPYVKNSAHPLPCTPLKVLPCHGTASSLSLWCHIVYVMLSMGCTCRERCLCCGHAAGDGLRMRPMDWVY